MVKLMLHLGTKLEVKKKKNPQRLSSKKREVK